MSTHRTVAAAVLIAAIGLAALFWWPLVAGGGLIGGDVYNYFFPQKVVYADELQRGELPLWNNRVGQGYPIVGESQTGVFYPLNALLYYGLSINAAYNANFLLHYVLAFVFTWIYARSIGLGEWGSGLAALVYTYGWFPPRCSLEWSIIGGAWFPCALWCCEKLLTSRQFRFALGLCVVLALQLLAGHFNLAFLTLLTLIPYTVVRLFYAHHGLPADSRSRRTLLLATVAASIVCSFGMAALQIAPAWELKQLSQRQSPGPDHNLAAGSIPPWYLSQLIAPWHWYSLSHAAVRQSKLDESAAALGGRTNEVEAHLYVGLVPLALALAWMVIALRTGDRLGLMWGAFGLAALCYTPGWLLGLTQHLPGFSFFSAAGRYGVITALAAGILAGKAFDRLRATGSWILSLLVLVAFAAAMFTALTLTGEAQAVTELNGSRNPFILGNLVISDGMVTGLALIGLAALLASFVSRKLGRGSSQESALAFARWTLTACVLIAPALEFWLVSRVIAYSDLVNDPPIVHLAESPVRALLAPWKGTARLLAPEPNLATVLGAAATPVYLTFGPAVYFDRALAMPAAPVAAKVDWLRRAGVTHVLSFTPLDPRDWPVRLIWTGFDPFLNPAMARYSEAISLYELQGSRGRVAWKNPAPGATAQIVDYRGNRVSIEAESSKGGALILTDLMFPGWRVAIDGDPAEPFTFEQMFRAVEVPAGRHTVVWSYQPRSVYWGMVISGLTALFLSTLALNRSPLRRKLL